jgi:tight junction protein 1
MSSSTFINVLAAQYRREEYDQIVQNQRGDSFYIKAHFTYDQTEKGEMSFKKCDVFHVVDTLHNGVVGSWQAFRMGQSFVIINYFSIKL